MCPLALLEPQAGIHSTCELWRREVKWPRKEKQDRLGTGSPEIAFHPFGQGYKNARELPVTWSGFLWPFFTRGVAGEAP